MDRLTNMLHSVENMVAFTEFTAADIWDMPVWEFMELLYTAETRADKAAAEASKPSK